MNIYDVYVTRIYACIDSKRISYMEVNKKYKYVRDAIVIRKKTGNSNIYYDLMSDKKYTTPHGDCCVGDEFVVPEKRYDLLVNLIDYKETELEVTREQVLELVYKRKRKEV